MKILTKLWTSKRENDRERDRRKNEEIERMNERE